MRVLMLGWEFPPLFAGGVGIVCYELTKTLAELDNTIDITYIMPFGPKNFSGSQKTKHVNLIIADNKVKDKKVNVNIEIKTIPTLFEAYMTPEEYSEHYARYLYENDLDEQGNKKLYGKNLYLEVERYAQKVGEILAEEGKHYDVIHAHDWMTIPAGIVAKGVLKRPLIIHVHNTIYDRYLGSGGDHEKEIEMRGYNCADRVIAISFKIEKILMEKYGVPKEKIEVIHNGGITDLKANYQDYEIDKKKEKVVLYAGRVVLQKGPEYFIKAAQKVLQYEPNVKFVMAGTGHQLDHLKHMCNEMGISNNVYFHGFYTRDEAERFFSIADIFVMPSISEPFGIVPLEAIAKGTPVIISKQSGISEVLENCFKVDFWDTDKMAHQIITLLRYEPLHNQMRKSAFDEFQNFGWEKPSKKIIDLYKNCMNKH